LRFHGHDGRAPIAIQEPVEADQVVAALEVAVGEAETVEDVN
jgi:hypothetical protein